MAIETNTYSVDMATGLLENYLVGKRAIEIVHGGMSLVLEDGKILAVGKNHPQTEMWLVVSGVGTIFCPEAKIVTYDGD